MKADLDKRNKPEISENRPRKKPYRRVAGWAIFLLFLLLIGVPFYITSQPEYYARYKVLRPYYLAWRASTHGKMDCKDCHRKQGLQNVAAFEIKNIADFYLFKFRPPAQPDIFFKPTKQSCFLCHTQYRTVSPSGDLLIPHRAHVEVIKLTCVDCHKWLVHQRNPKGMNTPVMTNCLKCHNGKRAPAACKGCHTEKAYPASHTAVNWLQVHSEKTKEINCAQCHGWTPTYCRQCHRQRPTGHAGNWKKLHSVPAKINSNRCLVCHEKKRCLECHD